MATVICDLDGTLFNIDHRLHYLDTKEWDRFFEAVKYDTANDWCVQLLHALDSAGHRIIYVSGRSNVARTETLRQLRELGLIENEDNLFMRPVDSREPDWKLKRKVYHLHLKNEDILFVIEDRSQVVQMWRNEGLTVLQCDEGSY